MSEEEDNFDFCTDSQSFNRFERFREYIGYDELKTVENQVVSPVIAENIIHKAVNVHGGYLLVEKQLRKVQEVSQNDEQMNTIYGRTHLDFFNTLIDGILKQFGAGDKEPSFIDLGSGIGTLVLYFSLITGFKATGIECNEKTVAFSELIKEYVDFFVLDKKVFKGCDNTTFHQRDLFEKNLKPIIKSHTILFMNNAHETFGLRTVMIGTETLDERICKIFLSMKRNTFLISFEKQLILHDYPNEISVEIISSSEGKGVTSWTATSGSALNVFIYKLKTDVWSCPTCSTENFLTRTECKVFNCFGKVIRTKGYCLRKINHKVVKSKNA